MAMALASSWYRRKFSDSSNRAQTFKDANDALREVDEEI